MRIFTCAMVFSFFLAATLAYAAVGEKAATAIGDRSPASMLTKRLFSVSASGATAESVIKMIGQKVGVPVQIEGDLSKRVSYEFADTTLENALQQMASDVGFTYSLRNDVLVVSKGGGSKGSPAGASQSTHLIELKYLEAEEIGQRLTSFIKEGESIHVDKKLNAIVFVGPESSLDKVKSFVDLFDRMPQQILIEAKIVETNSNFTREIGFLGGDLENTSLSGVTRPAKATGFSNPKRSEVPVMGLKFVLGSIAGRDLDLRLLAAENKGDAKVISRPKVVTINNTRALINSGLTINVKTLSTVTPAGGTAGAAASTISGGIEKLEAGLQLGVLPSVVDNNMVRLMLDVNNSQPDSEVAVDGIPGISTNSANTSVIVPDRATAVIAGLIKNSEGHLRSGVPFLSDIPILGLLFRNDNSNSRNNEMIILITPSILKSPLDNKGPVETAVNKVDAEKTE